MNLRFPASIKNFSISQQARSRGVIECRDKDSKLCRRAASFKLEVSGIAKDRGSPSTPAAAADRTPPRCGPMCRTRADPACSFVHAKLVNAVFKFARVNKVHVNDLDVVLSVIVRRGEVAVQLYCLCAAYLEPKTGGIAKASLVVVDLERRQDRESLGRNFDQV